MGFLKQNSCYSGCIWILKILVYKIFVGDGIVELLENGSNIASACRFEEYTQGSPASCAYITNKDDFRLSHESSCSMLLVALLVLVTS